MTRLPVALLVIGAFSAAAEPAPQAIPQSTQEFTEAGGWFGKFLPPSPGAVPAQLPFSFAYDGKPSAELLPGWSVRHTQRDLDAQRREAVATYTDLKSGLEVRCVAVGYRDFPTVEWTVYFKNTGKADTPILAGIQALDARWERAGAPYSKR